MSLINPLYARAHTNLKSPANNFLNAIYMNAQAAAAQTYTPEEIAVAMAYRDHARAVERAKYVRNKEHRLAYAKAYRTARKEAAAAAAAAANPPNNA